MIINNYATFGSEFPVFCPQTNVGHESAQFQIRFRWQ